MRRIFIICKLIKYLIQSSLVLTLVGIISIIFNRNRMFQAAKFKLWISRNMFHLRPVWPNIDQYMIHLPCSHVWFTFVHFKMCIKRSCFFSFLLFIKLVLLSPRGSYTWSDAYDNCKANDGYLASDIGYNSTVDSQKSSSAWVGKVELTSKWLQIMGKIC